MICWTWVISFLPNFPAGCELAKSFFVKPLDSKSAIANASPKARAEVVDDVGARSSGHASLLIFKTDTNIRRFRYSRVLFASQRRYFI
jgi:hypothetical protein